MVTRCTEETLKSVIRLGDHTGLQVCYSCENVPTSDDHQGTKKMLIFLQLITINSPQHYNSQYMLYCNTYFHTKSHY